jgi:hypothetical protein
MTPRMIRTIPAIPAVFIRPHLSSFLFPHVCYAYKRRPDRESAKQPKSGFLALYSEWGSHSLLPRARFGTIGVIASTKVPREKESRRDHRIRKAKMERGGRFLQMPIPLISGRPIVSGTKA